MNNTNLFLQNLTRKQSEDSPAIEAYKPGSRQYQAEPHRCFNWPGYWKGGSSWGEVVGNADQITEGITQLGGVAEGTVSMAASRAFSTFDPKAGDAINEASTPDDADTAADLYYTRH